MATDYDAPRKADDDTESIEAIKERVPAKTGASDTEVDDSGDSFSIPDVVSEDLEVVVLPPQDDEFTCSSCFIVKHRSLVARKTKNGPICSECDA
jgi:Domain of unknown function (DUF4193)